MPTLIRFAVGAALVAALAASGARADAPRGDEDLPCPEGEARDADSGQCKPDPKRADAGVPDHRKSSRKAPPPEQQGAPKTCPPGERLQQVVCIRAPCPPQCVPIPKDESK